MVTRLGRQARRYQQFGSSLCFAAVLLPSLGQAPPPSNPTVARRRYPQFGRTLALVKTLDSLGNPSGGSGGGGAPGGITRAMVANNPNVYIYKQSTARNRVILMTSSTDHITGAAGLSLTITASKDGGAFASITPTVTDLGTGDYKLALTTSHTDTLGDLVLHITAVGADPLDVFGVVELDRTGATVTSVTGNVSGSVGSISGITFPTNFNLLSIDANGRVKVLTGVTKNTALSGFMFMMTDSGTHAPKSGLGSGVTGTVSKDGGSFNSLTNAVTEISGGWYKVDLAATDLNGTTIALRFTGSAADDTDITIVTSS